MPPKKGAKTGKVTKGMTDVPSASVSSQLVPDNIVIVLHFTDMEAMADGLARVSAWVEDPIHHGKALSVSEALSANIIARRYAGHNFPLPSYTQAITELTGKGSLTSAEKIVNRLILSHSQKFKDKSKVYVIAYAGDMQSALEHEKKHAMFYFCPDFRSRVEGIWGSVLKTNASWATQFQQHLGKSYCQKVWLDEFQAIVLNREYECTMKMLQLLQSIVPFNGGTSALPYGFVTVPVSFEFSLPKSEYEDYGTYE